MPGEPFSTAKEQLKSDGNPATNQVKGRRNRPTQSCYNCHTSKRMCTRKRPACARCIELGLTGLCIYEVDISSPSQRSHAEASLKRLRLLKKVAKLERVARGDKSCAKKTQPETINPEVYQRPYLQLDTRRIMSPSDGPPLSPLSDEGHSLPKSDSRPKRASSFGSIDRIENMTFSSVAPIQVDRSPVTPPPHCDSPLFGLIIPDSGYGQVRDAGLEVPVDNGISPLHSSCSNLTCNASTFNAYHCGCLQEWSNHSARIQLSLPLKIALDRLTSSANHRLGRHCFLQQHLLELDDFLTTAKALATVLAAPEGLPTPTASPLDGPQFPWTVPVEDYPPASYVDEQAEVSSLSQPLQNVYPWSLEAHLPNPANPFSRT